MNLSAYPLKTYVDGGLNTIDNTLSNKQNNLTFTTPLIKDVSNYVIINYALKTGDTMTGNLTVPNSYLTNPTGATSSIYFSPTPSIYSLFSRKVPWAMYFAKDFNTTISVLPNYLNNGTRDATTTGTITKKTGPGNCATGNITYITGGAVTSIHDQYLGNEGLEEVLVQQMRGLATTMVLKSESRGR
jgi:hypothetical protein